MTQIMVYADYFVISAVVAGIFSALFGNHDNDEEIIAANEYILDALSDRDRAEVIKAITDKDIRSQLSVEQAEALQQEIELLKMGHRRN